VRQGHRHTPGKEWGRKNRKEEDRLRGLNNQARRAEIAEQVELRYVYCPDHGLQLEPCPWH
jgi:hypothetical protein